MFRLEHKNHYYRNKELSLGITIGDQHKADPFMELNKSNKDIFVDDFAHKRLTIKCSENDNSTSIFDAKGK